MHYKLFIERLRQFKKEILPIAGNEMVNFAQDNIRAEGFNGQKWEPRSPNAPRNDGRGLLVDKGDGVRSIRVVEENDQFVAVSANEYMEAHNIGAKISGTFSVKSHTRLRRGRNETVKAHTRTVNTQLPKRTFLASGDALNKRIIKALLERFNNLTR
jgi:phage gpG-like protein